MNDASILLVMYIVYLLALYLIDAKKYVNPFLIALIMGRPKGVYKIVKAYYRASPKDKFIVGENPEGMRYLLFYNRGKKLAFFNGAVEKYKCLAGTYIGKNDNLKLQIDGWNYALLSEIDGTQVKYVLTKSDFKIPNGAYTLTTKKATSLTPLGLVVNSKNYILDKDGFKMYLKGEKNYYCNTQGGGGYYIFPFLADVAINNKTTYNLMFLIDGETPQHIVYSSETI